MRTSMRGVAARLFLLVFLAVCLVAPHALSQSIANSGMIQGTVTDPTGAVIPGATVTIQNPVSQYLRSMKTNSAGQFGFTNIPFNPYHMTVTAKGFGAFVQDEDVRSSVTINVPVKLQLGTSATTVHVTGEDLLENSPTFHTDVSRHLFEKLPLESQSSGLSSLVTLASPGISADSNGLFHGMGDHASNSFSIDGQSITDQVSKVFSNQLPVSSIQSMEVIDGAPPAEYGDKTSVVVVATTRSGQGITRPTGQIYSCLWQLRVFNRRLRCRLRQAELGQLHLRRPAQHRPLSRSSRVRGFPRQRERGKYLRPHRLHPRSQELPAHEFELQPFLVPDSRFL